MPCPWNLLTLFTGILKLTPQNPWRRLFLSASPVTCRTQCASSLHESPPGPTARALASWRPVASRPAKVQSRAWRYHRCLCVPRFDWRCCYERARRLQLLSSPRMQDNPPHTPFWHLHRYIYATRRQRHQQVLTSEMNCVILVQRYWSSDCFHVWHCYYVSFFHCWSRLFWTAIMTCSCERLMSCRLDIGSFLVWELAWSLAPSSRTVRLRFSSSCYCAGGHFGWVEFGTVRQSKCKGYDGWGGEFSAPLPGNTHVVEKLWIFEFSEHKRIIIIIPFLNPPKFLLSHKRERDSRMANMYEEGDKPISLLIWILICGENMRNLWTAYWARNWMNVGKGQWVLTWIWWRNFSRGLQKFKYRHRNQPSCKQVEQKRHIVMEHSENSSVEHQCRGRFHSALNSTWSHRKRQWGRDQWWSTWTRKENKTKLMCQRK